MHLSKLNIVLISLIFIIAGGLVGGYLYMKDLLVPLTPVLPPAPVVIDTQSRPVASTSGVKKFKDYAELQKFLEKHSPAVSYYGEMNLLRRGMMKQSITDSIGVVAPLAASVGESGGGGGDYSRTNIQVEGVDEADIVKTDGKYIYALAQNTIHIVSVSPADKSEIVSEVKFASSSPAGLFVSGDRLVVYGSDWGAPLVASVAESRMMMPIRTRQRTFLKVYDIADKKNPIVKRDLSFDGYYSNARLIGDYVYFVVSAPQYDYAGEFLPPRVMENGAPVNAGREMPVYYFDIPYRSQNFITISGINLNDATEPLSSEAYLLDGNQGMYVSQNNIYLTYTRYVDEYRLMMEVMKEIVLPKLSAKDRERISKIEVADSDIISEQEKQQKISAVVERYVSSLSEEEQKSLTQESQNRMKQKYEDWSKELEKTIIHKIAISGGKTFYQTMGEVSGHILNQFSMDENSGYFRIATTKSPSWSVFAGEDNAERKSYNNLYILDANLKITGKIENLATNERVYSVRFMQDRAYIVTFKQTDPLFVIDVKDPAAPKILGELKIPGFSTYLHPYNDATLIGLGKETETDESGNTATKGLKISLFDVSDTTNPKEAAHYVVEGQWSDSAALYDHKAFLFSKDKNLLVIPVLIGGGEIQNDFAGVFVFNIAKDAITLKGKITHSKNPAGFDYSAGISRSLYIENALYTLSDGYLGANSLTDLALIKNIEFSKQEANDVVQIIPSAPAQINPSR